MTLIGVLALLGWIPAAGFMIEHARTQWRTRPAGVAVMVMALVVFAMMTLSLIRYTFEIDLPAWVRAVAYGGILVALWWKFVTIIRYRYSRDAHLSVSDERETVA